MSQAQAEANLTNRIQETLELATNRVEEIHKSIAEAPLEVMRQSGVFEQTAEDVSELQERSISVAYDTVRDVNRRIVDLAAELLRLAADLSEAESAREPASPR